MHLKEETYVLNDLFVDSFEVHNLDMELNHIEIQGILKRQNHFFAVDIS